jgi:molybdopterin converting factor small subunit
MSRRVHASYFANVDKKYSDGIVMLFGNNETTIKKLLKQYKVKYFYLDQNVINSPMITNIRYSEYLQKNGIEFTIENVRLDPSSNRAPTFESLIIPAQNLTILKFANPIKEVTANGQKIAILYAIK